MLRNRKGSATILIMLLFVTLVSMVMIFVKAAKSAGIRSSAKELGLVWCESVLGEYDLNLQGRYGIFGFNGIAKDINEKINFYATASFGNKKYIKVENADCDLYPHSLESTVCFNEQIVKEGKCAVLNKDRGIKEIKAANDAHTISPKNIKFSDLPSHGSADAFSIKRLRETLRNIKNFDELIKAGTDKYFQRKYIEKYFKNRADEKKLGKTFFRCEQEYILNGKNTDEENESSTKKKIILLRSVMNMIYLQSDKVKSAETLAAAELLTPGPWAAATQKAIQAAWSLAEARNDYHLLINGEKVPFYKDSSSWATDIESIIKSAKEKKKGKDKKRNGGGRKPVDEKGKKRIDKSHGESADPGRNSDEKDGKSLTAKDFDSKVPYINPDNKRGEKYEEYISGMIMLIDNDVKLLRMMDLIEINMKILYYGGFKIKDYNRGLTVRLKINGENYVFKKTYG